jgi:HSP20 family protein
VTLMRTDPFRDLDRLAQQVFGGVGTRPTAMPMDAYRDGDTFVVLFDLPGVNPDSIDLNVERNVLTVRAEREDATPENAEVIVSERPTGAFSRQLILSDTLDTEHVEARYENGELKVTIPVAEQAKPRKIQITSGSEGGKEIRG